MATLTGLLLGNNLAAGASLGRAATSVAFFAAVGVYNNEKSAASMREADELWPQAGQQG